MSGGPNPAAIIDLVVLAARRGEESAWVAEGMAACAMRTSRILGAGPCYLLVSDREAPERTLAGRRNGDTLPPYAGSLPNASAQ
jgi:hypothetical protein